MIEHKLIAVGSDPGEWAGTYITFTQADPFDQPASGKTTVWEVCNTKEGTRLGFVKWFGRWRKYAFFPIHERIFEEVCLREIALFCEERTKEHRTGV